MIERLDYENELALLLTASVDTKAMPGVSRADPKERERDYIESLTYYMKEHPRIRRIIFVENSGWPLEELRKCAQSNPHGKEIEFLSLDCNDYPREMGKGYGEFLLMDRALEQSKTVPLVKYVAKLTGRAIFANISAVLGRVPRGFDLLCDIRDHGFYDMLGIKAAGRWCDTRFFAFTPAFYDAHFRGKYTTLDARIPTLPENLLYDTVKANSTNAKIIRRFAIEPMFRGTTAHWNKDYDSPRERAKRLVRGSLRRIAPWLHI